MAYPHWLINFLFILLFALPALSQTSASGSTELAEVSVESKTDVVVLRNGDRITGEVKSLRNAKLQFKTDDAGTLSIEWNKILALTAKAYLK